MKEPRRPKQASLRRAVSAACYALFHLLVDDAERAFLDWRVVRGSAQADTFLVGLLAFDRMRA